MKRIAILLLIASVMESTSLAAENTNKCPVVRLQNGRVRTRGRGRIIRFSCYEGFTLVGDRYSTCIRGEWDTPTPLCVNSQCPELAKPEHALVVSKYGGAILIYFCEPGYKISGPEEIYCDGRQWNGTTPSCRDTTAVASTWCDFEREDLCWWEQDPKHDFDWIRHNFETPSAHVGTGPTYDHTLGPGNDGYYLYIEASGRLVNDTARIMSPIYNSSLTRSGCFTFWYHMYGETMGALRVYFKSEEDPVPRLMFNKEGNQGNQWLYGIFQLPPSDHNFQIIIEGVRGSNYVSDIAVDDVAILQGNDCVMKNKTSVTAPSDDDQIEIINAAQSCQGRCVNSLSSERAKYPDFMTELCHCTIDCAENSTCCPDYAEYCVLAITDVFEITASIVDMSSIEKSTEKMTGTIDIRKTLTSITTTSPGIITTIIPGLTSASGEETAMMKNWHSSTTNKNTQLSIDPSVNLESKNESRTTKSDRRDASVKDPSFKYENDIIISTISSTRTNKPESYFTLINDVDAPNENMHNPDMHQETDVELTSQNSQYLNPTTSSNSSLDMIGVMIGVIAALKIFLIPIFLIIWRRKLYKKSKNSSGLSEDSDVRFLTSDEVLDFTVARPASNEYSEL